MKEMDAIQALAALAQSNRLRIFRALVGAGDAGMSPGAIADALGLPGPTLSFHLKELLHAGLISQRRSGRSLIYRAEYRRMNALLDYLTANCCGGATCEVAPVARKR